MKTWTGITTVPKVRAVVFREHEGTFLAGALAGRLTRSKVGFVGGMQLPLIRKFETGFRAGVRWVNPAVEVLVAYTGTFDDERKGIEVGHNLYRRGCDIVFHAAGLDGLGVIKAAQQAGKLVIGVPNIASWEARVFGERWRGLEVPRHLYQYSAQSLADLLRAAGFNDIRMRTQFKPSTFSESVDFVLNDLLGLRRHRQRMSLYYACFVPAAVSYFLGNAGCIEVTATKRAAERC